MRWRDRSWLVVFVVLTGPISAACSAEVLDAAVWASKAFGKRLAVLAWAKPRWQIARYWRAEALAGRRPPFVVESARFRHWVFKSLGCRRPRSLLPESCREIS